MRTSAALFLLSLARGGCSFYDECPSLGVLRSRCDGRGACAALAKCANSEGGELLRPEDVAFTGSRAHREATAEEIQLYEEGMRHSFAGTRGRRCEYGHVDVGALRRGGTDCVAGLDSFHGIFELLCTCAPPELAQQGQSQLVRSWAKPSAAVFLGLGLLGLFLVGASHLVLCLAADEPSGSRARPQPSGTAPLCAWFLRMLALASFLGVSIGVFALSVAARDPEEAWGEWPYTYYVGCAGHIVSGGGAGSLLALVVLTAPPGAILVLAVLLDYALQKCSARTARPKVQQGGAARGAHGRSDLL